MNLTKVLIYGGEGGGCTNGGGRRSIHGNNHSSAPSGLLFNWL